MNRNDHKYSLRLSLKGDRDIRDHPPPFPTVAISGAAYTTPKCTFERLNSPPPTPGRHHDQSRDPHNVDVSTFPKFLPIPRKMRPPSEVCILGPSKIETQPRKEQYLSSSPTVVLSPKFETSCLIGIHSELTQVDQGLNEHSSAEEITACELLAQPSSFPYITSLKNQTQSLEVTEGNIVHKSSDMSPQAQVAPADARAKLLRRKGFHARGA